MSLPNCGELELTDNTMLKRIERAAKRVANRINKMTKEYSKQHFELKQNQPYISPLTFDVFTEPVKVDPKTNRRFLVATQRILLAVECILLTQIQDNDIDKALTWCENVWKILEKYKRQLVVHPEHYTWQPQEMSYSQLEGVANDLAPRYWPIPVYQHEDTMKLLINLTLMEQLAITMKKLQHSAHSLRYNH